MVVAAVDSATNKEIPDVRTIRVTLASTGANYYDSGPLSVTPGLARRSTVR